MHLKFRCLDYCSSHFEYHGLINGNQCACGAERPDEKYKKAESHCGTACPGDGNANCGGADNRVNVYKIK